MAIPLMRTSAGEFQCKFNHKLGEKGNRKLAGRPADEGTPQGGPLSAVDAASSHCTPQMGKFRASGRGAGCRIMERLTGQGWREWAETMPDRDAELARPAGLRSQSALVAFRRCTIW